MTKTITEYKLAEDIKELLLKNPDARCMTQKIENTIKNADDEDILEIHMEIYNGITITSVKIIKE